MKIFKIQNLIVSLVVISAVLYFFNQRKYETDVESSEIAVESDYLQKLKSAPNQKIEIQKSYERKPLSNQVTIRDLRALGESLTDPVQFARNLQEIKQRQEQVTTDLDYPQEMAWDLNQAPASQADYQNLLAEAKYRALYLISKGLETEDASLIRKSVAGLQALEIYKVFVFKGYDEKGKLVLSLPDDFVVQNKKRRAAIAKKLEAEKKRKVANTATPTVQNTEALNLEALFQEKLAQTAYFSDHETSTQAIDEYWGGESSMFSNVTETCDYIINAVATSFFNLTPESYQGKLEDSVGKTLEDARANPEYYNLNGVVPKNVTDLDFEFFAETISRDVSFSYALMAAGLSTVLGEFAANQLVAGGRLFAASFIISLGAESLFGAIGSYRGTLLLILLQRYQNYMTEAKDFLLRVRGQNNFSKDDVEPFQPEKVFYSETTRMELNKSFLWGFGFGMATNKWITLSLSQKLGRTFGVFAMTMAASSNMSLAKTGRTLRILNIFAKSSLERSLAHLLRAPFVGQGFLKRLLKMFKKALSVTPAHIATIVGDFVLTSLSVFTAVHVRLYGVTQMLNRVYESPQVAVQVATQSDWHSGEDFLTASRKHFYRLCYFAATNELSREQINRGESNLGEGEILPVFESQVRKCLQVIAGFEKVPLTRAEDHLRRLASTGEVDTETVNLFINRGKLNREDIVGDIVAMFKHYPSHFRIIWTTALKTIFISSKPPEEYYAFKNLLLTGDGGNVYENDNNLRELNPVTISAKINASRFEYIIEKLAFRAHKLKVDSGYAEENEPLNSSEAFSCFWQYYANRAPEFDSDVLTFLDQDQKGLWGYLWGGLKQSWRSLQFLVSRLINPVYEGTYRYEIEKEIAGPGWGQRLKDFIKKPNN